MIIIDKFIWAFCLFIGSCGLKTQDVTTCEDSYSKNELKECYTCTKDYLQSNPTNIDAIALFVKCTQTQDELEFVDRFIRLQYDEHEKVFKKNIDFWIITGGLHMKMGDSLLAKASYSIAHTIDSNFTGLNYKLALTNFAVFRDEDINEEIFSSNNQKKYILDDILNYLNMELINNPNDSATFALINEVQSILDKLK